MATQRCPKCNSDRVRLGYRPTPAYLKILFRYNLLCDQCNWEFTGFAIPGTVPKKTKKRKPNVNINQNSDTEFSEAKDDLIDEILAKKNDENEVLNSIDLSENKINEEAKQPFLFEQPIVENENVEQEIISSESKDLKKQKVKKKIRVKFY